MEVAAIRERIRARPEPRHRIAKEAGVSESWLLKFCCETTEYGHEPRMSMLQKLNDWLDDQDRGGNGVRDAEPERAAS